MTAQQHLPNDQAAPYLVHCSIADAARLLAIDERTVRERIANGLLPAIPGDGDWTVLLPQLLLQEQTDVPDTRSASPPATGANQRVSASGSPRPTDVGRLFPRGALIGLMLISAIGTGWLVAWFGSTWLARDTSPLPTSNFQRSAAASAGAARPSPTAGGAPAAIPPGASTSATANAAVGVPLGPTAAGSGDALAAASPASTPRAPLSADELMQRVAQVAADVRSCWLEAQLDYGSSTSTAEIRFDVERADEPRLHISTAYVSGDQVQRVEQIMIGEKAWERRGTEDWRPIAGQEGVWSQVQTFLPRALSGATPTMEAREAGVELRWHDAGRNTDVTVLVDPNTGEPREMQQLLRGSNTVMRVVYRGWNTPVQIAAP